MAQIIPISPPNYNLVDPSSAPGPGWGSSSRPEPGTHGASSLVALNLFRRYWVMMVTIVALSVGLAYVITREMTPIYRSSTTLYFAERQSSVPALDLLNQIENGNNEVATEMEVMRSRAVAEDVVDSLGLQATVTAPAGATTSSYIRLVSVDPKTPLRAFRFEKTRDDFYEIRDANTGAAIGSARPGQTIALGGATLTILPGVAAQRPFEVTLRPRSVAVDALMRSISVSRPNPTASVVQVSYNASDPIETQNVPARIAATYLAWRANLRKTGDRSTVEFLKQQIDTISKQLYAAEENLRRFRESNQVTDLPTQAQTEVQRLATLEAQRADIDIQRSSLRSLLREVQSAPADPQLGSPYRRLMAFPGLMTNANPAFSLLQNLTSLEQNRTELLVRRTTNDPDVQALTQAINHIESQIAAVVNTYLQGLDQQSSSLSRGIAEFNGRVVQVPKKEVEYARLDRQASGLTQIYTMLETRLREAQIAEAVDDGAVRVVDPASLPLAPIAPKLFLNIGVGLVAGMLLAFFVGFLRERLDRSVHTKEDAEFIGAAPVLAMIPHIGARTATRHRLYWQTLKRTAQNARIPATTSHTPDKLVLNDPQSVAAEAFRKLRTNISFARPDSPPRVIVFTSPSPGEGKSTSVVNLAVALVQQGKKVLIIDGDMRRGGLHKMLDGAQSLGLSEILVGLADYQTAVQSLSMQPFGTVDLLAMGVIPPNPAELLASARFSDLIAELRPLYDAILIDSPPVNLVTDAAVIGRHTDGAVLVARAAKTSRSQLAHAASQLRQVQVGITGLILNDYNPRRDGTYAGPYYYGYSVHQDYSAYSPS